MALSREQFDGVVASTDFDQLVGEIENVWFDCKSQPYQVENDKGKRDLAKDVSSFANTQGGVILIGVKTDPSSVHLGDEIKEIRPFAQGLVNTIQYRDIIKSWIYPEVEGVVVEWVSSMSESAKGIIVIKIPKQKNSLKPFLIVKTLDGKKQVETVFGFVQRKGDKSQSLTVVDLQRTLRSGFNYENELKERLDVLEVLLRQVAEKDAVDLDRKIDNAMIESKQVAKKDAIDLDRKIDNTMDEAKIETALGYEDIGKKRILILSAYSDQLSELRTIFSTAEGSIRKRLEDPPVLRYAGWDLQTLDRAKIMRGQMIRVVNGSRKVIDLYRDGTFVFVGLADHEFLSRGDSPEKQKIHPVAIVEIIYNFVNFYKLVLDDFQEVPGKIFLRVDFRNMQLGGIKNYLVPYGVGSFDQMYEDDKGEAPGNDFMFVKPVKIQDYDVAIVAYELLREVYLWFGLEEEKIPYVKKENGIKMVDADAIKKL